MIEGGTALPRLCSAPLQKQPLFLLIYASHRVFTGHSVFRRERRPARRVPVPGPAACQKEQALSVWGEV